MKEKGSLALGGMRRIGVMLGHMGTASVVRGASTAAATRDGGTDAELAERYRASMVLSGVGDAMGYHNGKWEFCHSGRDIHDDLKKMGGLDKLVLAGNTLELNCRF